MKLQIFDIKKNNAPKKSNYLRHMSCKKRYTVSLFQLG